MKNTEQWISQLEAESNALNVAFERDARRMPIFTKTANFRPGSGNFFVTYNTTSGADTIAKIELFNSSESMFVRPRRVRFNGGARWLVLNQLDGDFNIAVHAMLPGNLIVSDA